MDFTDKNPLYFDAHLHIINPDFPFVPNKGYLPEQFTCNDYLDQTRHNYPIGRAIVSGSFQAFDQTYLVDALRRLGPTFVGVTQLPSEVSDEEILTLHDSGVRALRFNLKRGGSEEVQHMDSMARRVHELAGWHIELYVDSTMLDRLYATLIALLAISIDHLGLSAAGFKTLVKLVEKGAYVKATGFGRVDFEVSTALCDLYSCNPEALMFGTDLPSTRAPRPYQDSDLLLVIDALGEKAAASVLYKNAVALYQPKDNMLAIQR